MRTKDMMKQAGRKKQRQVLKYIEDLLKDCCKAQAERIAPPFNLQKINQESEPVLKKQVAEWSAENFLDCWVISEGDLIEAKAFFNKKSPQILNNLKILLDTNL